MNNQIDSLKIELQSAWNDIENIQTELRQAEEKLKSAREYLISLVDELEQLTGTRVGHYDPR